ncbi:MAG: VCBS repeat-containing protein [Myxococcales bacterium]|nr:VCBS repeat-containing protein [Myxococcales bacterium]
MDRILRFSFLLSASIVATSCVAGDEPELGPGALTSAAPQAVTREGLLDPIDPGSGTVDPGGPPPPPRASVLGFPLGGATIERRFLMNHGAGDLPEMTGPADKQVVGDFKQLGRDQVLSINFEHGFGERRLMISTFNSSAPLGSPPPAPLYSELWGASTLLDGWDDEIDLALAGDFLGRGYDQLLLINRALDNGWWPDAPRARIIDFRGATPVVAFQQTHGEFGFPELAQHEDRVLVGDFRNLGRDQVLTLNGDPARVGRALAIHDFARAFGPLVPVVYTKNFAEIPELETWHDAADQVFAGNFSGYGTDQLLMLNRQYGTGRVRVFDFRWTDGPPLTLYWEEALESTALNGWHDAVSDWVFPGDFTGLGRDQLLFLNRRGSGGRALVADFGAGKPAKTRFLQPFGPPSVLDGLDDDDDIPVVGRFTAQTSDGLLLFNNAIVSSQRPERLVTSLAELTALLPADYSAAMATRYRGRILVPWWADWTLTSPLLLPTGVQLVGQRGALGQRPTLRYTSDASDLWGILVILGHHVRIEGLHLIGPANDNRSGSQKVSTAILGNVDIARQRGLHVVVADNELEHWTFAAYALANELSYRSTSGIDQRVPRQAPEDVGLVRFERNYVHHNHRNGAGYGVNLGGGAYITIEGNVFDRNRHAVSAGGLPFSGYTARHNFVLQGGYTESGFLGIDYWNQHFDVHGTASDGYGGLAGEHFLIEHNTIRGEQDGRPAFTLRGRPSLGAYFRNNVVVHDDLDEAVSLKTWSGSTGIGEDQAAFNFHPEPGNTYNTDRIGELATGDFDGDGRADVFLATGTGWFISHGGDSEWRFVRASTLVRSELAFADLDNDGKTDVAWRDASGWIVFARGGGAAQEYLATSPVPISELRFFDLGGDGKTDLFRVSGAQWLLWERTTGAWTVINWLGGTINELRFGQFDPYPGIDVAMATGGYWQFSSAGRSAWRPLNTAWQTSLSTTAAIDVDRDGRTDLVFREGSQWKWSRYGLFAPQVLRSGVDPVLDRVDAVLWGNFNGVGGTDALRWQGGSSVVFSTWQGPGSGDAAVPAWRTMR